MLLDFAEYPAATPLPVTVSAEHDTQASPSAAPVKLNRAPLAVKKNPPVPVASVSQDGEPEPARPKKEKAGATRRRAASGKDVLQVSEASSAEVDLKMSQTLTESVASNTDLQRMEENRLAQSQFAAIMRGEDPSATLQADIKKEQLKNKNLQDELARIKKQNAEKGQAEQNASPLLTGLIITVAALLTGLAGLVFLAIRRSKTRENKSWWDSSAEQKKNVVDIVDYLQSSAEQGNLDPNPITVARPVAPEAGFKPEVAPVAVKKEEPAVKFKRTGLPALEDTNSSTFNFFGNRGQSIHIEEISDITQEAEFWMSVNDPHRAIEILEPQSREENPATPVTWLYLLDLYRLVGDEDKYRDLRYRFKHKFNAKIPNFHEEVVATSQRNFDDFPHLVTNCCALWKTDDIGAYLESLLVDDREGERMGFDLPVYRDILFLLSICNELKRVKYQPLANKDDVKITNKAAATLTPLEDHLIVKPEDQEAGEYSNSLNFDLLDFNPDDKNKT